VTIETTGVPTLIKTGLDFTRPRGTMLQVGSAPGDFMLDIHCFTFMVSGKTYRGVIEGESLAAEYVPRMIQWYRDGRFPIDKLVKFMPAAEFEKGLSEMVS